MRSHSEKIAKELLIKPSQVDATVSLLDEGATVPFISRYRKERTGSLDDLAVSTIRDRIQQLRDLDKRRESILGSIEEQGKLTPELKAKINGAETMNVLEDLYLPYKPKRKTKASVAREKGLEPLSQFLWKQGPEDVMAEAAKYVNEEKGVGSELQAIYGARDIIAEMINEDASARDEIRRLFMKEGVISSKVLKGKETAAAKYKDYFEWTEGIDKIPSHRLLAIRRGEREMMLLVDIAPDEDEAVSRLERRFLKGNNESTEQVQGAIKDAYKRLMKPSLENEVRLESKKKADGEAIQVFSENLKQLLLAAPLGQKAVMAVDPGYRTGCKVVCLGKQGQLLAFEAIFPNTPQRETMKAGETVKHLVKQHNIEAIAIGNGTASRETEQFIRALDLPANLVITVVSESGASVYSASETARNEFPDQDVTVRGAVSIGRRLMDPLAELVKIDPKSIGVGQYQHDVDQSSLKKSLDDVVMACVNGVGVELNTASKELLTYVSGLGPQLAENIVAYRNENGPFKQRKDLRKVPRLGDKAFEQAAGFLRIQNGENLLDTSAVHPERYAIVEQMAKDLQANVSQLMSSAELRSKLNLKNYMTDEVGLPTLQDIVQELDKPGRDPREAFEVFQFADGITDITHLSVGMKLPGIVTNITKFGAFVDVGVHQDGLVHVSHLADKFVNDPSKVVKLQQHVQVTVTEVDVSRMRISLSLKADPFGQERQKKPNFKSKQKPRSSEPEGDLQAKLAMLKGKFNR
ncbi:MAG: Tex family protein [Cytophagales bacterium]|nr:Tex family protein [Cytophagales bacterium]